MKWFKHIVIAVAILIVLTLAIVYFSLNSILRSEIQKQASASLAVPTTLAGADLSLFGGKVSLDDLEVGSPPNFTAPHVFTVKGLSILVHYGQLRGNPVHISKITIDNPVVTIEQASLKLNLQALMDQMPQTPQTNSGQPAQPTKLIIDELDMNNAQVTFLPGLPGLTASLPISIPSLTLTNVGNADGNQNGVAIKQVVLQVATALASKAGEVGNLPPELKSLLSGSLAGISQQLGNIAGGVANLPANVGNLISGKGTPGSNPVDQAGSAIKGLFGGAPKKPGQ